jgi:2-polyprenyl-6-methoxyphenol hydroxylase-like FAD-dependent oxidoreductase
LGTKALIIGGSLGGLFAANLLRDVGNWDVEVFEKVGDDLAARGAGIATHPEMFDIIHRLGLNVDESFGITVACRRVLDKDGTEIYVHPNERLMSSWARFYRPLKDHLPADAYHFGKTLQRFEQDASGVTAYFQDGTSARGDLLIACDGSRSTVRTQLLPELQLSYASYIAWRGVVEETDMPARLRDALAEHVLGLPHGQYMTIYPVPGPNEDVRKGHRRSNFVWYHPKSAEELAALCTDQSGRCHGTAIPPQLLRPEAVAEMRELARGYFAPVISELVDMTRQPFFQAIFDLESPQVVYGRVALLGDAAFVARPHLGMGTTKAAMDANWLVDALNGSPGDIDAALGRYDRKVTEFGRRCVARAQWLGAHLEAQMSKPREMHTDHERNHLPFERMMQEFGQKIADIPELAEIAAKPV